MPNFYCEYCGEKFSNPRNLTSQNCMRHPSGVLKGKHKLYEGGEKSTYICKYCGILLIQLKLWYHKIVCDMRTAF